MQYYSMANINDWDKWIHQASDLISNRENYQRLLGRLANEISEKYGRDSLSDFSKEIHDTYGLLISPSTLKNYAWTWKKTHHLKLPKDLSYRTIQYIASSDDPEGWAERIKKEGLTSPEIFRLIRKEKGYPDTKKEKVCPHCGGIINEKN